MISTFKNVTNDSAREKLQELTVTRRICDQLAAAESAAIVNATVNATLQSDWKGDVWCKLVSTYIYQVARPLIQNTLSDTKV